MDNPPFKFPRLFRIVFKKKHSQLMLLRFSGWDLKLRSNVTDWEVQEPRDAVLTKLHTLEDLEVWLLMDLLQLNLSLLHM